MKVEEHKNIMGSVRRLFEARGRMKALDAVVKKESLAISNYMFSCLPNGVDKFDVRIDEGENFCVNPVTVTVTKVKRKKFIWDFKKLRNKIGKERFYKIVRKTYSITDFDGLVKYLKTCGVNPNEFAKYIKSEAVMDGEGLDYMLTLGRITRQDIEGCYDVEVSSSYIKVTEKKARDL